MLKSLFRFIFWLALTLVGGTFLGLAGMYLYLGPTLPSVERLRDIKLQTPLRVYSADNQLIGEFGEQRRTPIMYKDIPQVYIDALLAAEDEGFYSHNGVSIKGLMRAASHLLVTGGKKSGGSTITMQVTRHFFLHKKKHFKRKFNEILLAMRIEKELSKAEILELYVNVIFLGNRAYGIQAAANTYYGKPIDQLSIAQLATIAGLPKAPSVINPISNPARTKERRDWILGRMAELGKIDHATLAKALSEPITAQYHAHKLDFDAPVIAEAARQQAISLFGPKAYTDGYNVYTSIDCTLQAAAQNAIASGLDAYDARHGYRGAEVKLGASSTAKQLETLQQLPQIYALEAALITAVTASHVNVTFANQNTEQLDWATLSSGLRIYENENRTSAAPATPEPLLQTGDIIRLQQTTKGWRLAQIPAAQASLVSIDAYSGRVLALVGGYHFSLSSFNRATQAERQAGSNFKPFLYTAAIEHGYTPATLVNDAPVVFNDNKLENAWRPENSSGDFYGPMRLRKALYLSRNLVSIRVLRDIGIDTATKEIHRFGIDPQTLPHNLSLALGTHAMTPFSVAQGYTVFANGGYKIAPYLVDTITDDTGNTVYQSEKVQVCQQTPCPNNSPFNFNTDAFSLANKTQNLTHAQPLLQAAPRVLSEDVAFIMDSMLKDVVRKGTGTKARELKRLDTAGKTGTTNGPTDAWFSGYSGGIVTTTWVGFDDNQNLGKNEYGGSAALPIWLDYMRTALQDKPENNQAQPAGIISIRIDPETGGRARVDDPDAIFEVFRADNAPKEPASNSQNTSQDAVEYHEELF